jgi:hypothetical protein
MIRQDGTPTDLVSVTSDESPANSIGASSMTRLVFLPECGFHIPENPRMLSGLDFSQLLVQAFAT